MLAEQLVRRLAEVLHTRARGVEGGQQRQCLFSDRNLHQKWLAQLGIAQFSFDFGGGPADVAAAAGTA
jgi:hypothetical protein